MDKLISFYNENKELIQLIALALVWFFTHRQVAIGYAKKKASTLIFAAEKYSGDLLLKVGTEKMDFVVNEGYRLLPAAVRMFISMDTFRAEAQKLFDLAKGIAADKAKQVAVTNALSQVTPIAPIAEPAQPTQPVQQ
jgi:hypothetical protein